MHTAINLRERTANVQGFWNPEHLLTLDQSHSLKIANVKGGFIWHSHPNTDEMFYCVSGGPLRMELCTTAKTPEDAEKTGPDEVVVLNVGDVFSVPRGMQHRPVAENETGILMIEKVGTVNTGDREGDERTVYVDEKA
ncbi:hypothetical protein LTR91_005282 [Friedmanniomyces endolithicus]|uniref:Cupin type-1 domain-containing protein n=1 Tax=Friedmanniomyces endolithicus TaxID=329885 RepID=A0AAN6QY54_9PEZI|nr:hypothetical protein LTR94_009666 [Friedmanniomyces endolithicus]KAK0791516.1 hypothetical protein LTR59_008909 [Friedmanniomyces endolithicus]KAK0808256.1 hypothetical protein LTR75_006320 [Friedmanniomyces endolithicus]KAK0810463.1 hypothetical protein LTR38_003948 [Friedmanniomyces endolithicus]KAK0838965.1 hypothetical protein LTR03_011624 [Friedmanniomyces endolithicus]